MAKSRSLQVNIDYYLENLCVLSHKVYGICVFLSFSEDFAKESVNYAFEQAADQLEQVSSFNNNEVFLFKKCWKYFIENDKVDSKSKIPEAFAELSHTDKFSRAVFVSLDLLGMSLKEAKDLFGLSEDEIQEKIVAIRKQLSDLRAS